MRYRRADVKGGTYFFTVNLAQRHLRLLLDHVEILREAVKTVKQRHPFHIDAFVVLSDHLHAIWTLPPDDADFATRWMLIKSGFSRHITINERRNASRISKGEHGYVHRASEWSYSSIHRYIKARIISDDWGGDVDNNDKGGYGER